MEKSTNWIIRIMAVVVLAAIGSGFYIFNEKLDVIDGKIEVPNTPGLGVTIKEELIIRE